MSDISKIREKFPQYSDISDSELAFRLYQKSYSDMPLVGFTKSLNMDKSEALDFLKFASKQGKTLAFKDSDPNIGGRAGGIARSTLQGLTFGGGDELVAGGVAAGRKLVGDERAIGDIYSQELGRERSRISQFQEVSPVTSAVTEFAGAAAVPLSAARNVKQALGLGAATGAVTGGLTGEGAEDRLRQARNSAILGGVLGASFQKAGDLIGTQFEKVMSNRAAKAISEGADSVEQLRLEAGDAYKAARDAGVVIDEDAYLSFVEGVIEKVSGGPGRTVRSKLTPKAADVIDTMYDDIGKVIGLEDLEYYRQLAQAPAGKTTDKAEQRAAMLIINGLDEFVDNLSPSQISSGDAKKAASELKKARALWQKMRKSEEVGRIIDVAESGGYAGGFESGIKNQFSAILRNPKRSKGYTKAELELMSEIVQGSPLGRVFAGISYLGLSPSGGRTPPIGGALFTGATAGALTGDPTMAVIGAGVELGATTALRAVREWDMGQRARTFQQLVASGSADKVRREAPEVFKLLQEAATAATRGTVATGSPSSIDTGLLSQ